MLSKKNRTALFLLLTGLASASASAQPVLDPSALCPWTRDDRALDYADLYYGPVADNAIAVPHGGGWLLPQGPAPVQYHIVCVYGDRRLEVPVPLSARSCRFVGASQTPRLSNVVCE